jgi:dipeptidyl-peptidase III
MDPATRAHYLADSPPTVVRLEIAPHFNALNAQQKRYAHHLSRASFYGTRVTLAQVSPESIPIYDLIITIHKACKGDYKSLASSTGASDDAVRQWLEYAAQFLGNCGNYKGFGDSKFIPRVEAADLAKISSASSDAEAAYKKASSTGGGIYETKDTALMHLGYPDAGHMSTYYPDTEPITKDEIQIVGEVLEAKGLPIENTRLRKTKTGDFELLIASSDANPGKADRDLGNLDSLNLTGALKDKKLRFVFGDYQEQMAAIEKEIKLAEKEALNETETKMMAEYAKSFGKGSIEAYKESQRYWIKDKKPMVETDIGFVETYRDPHGVRGEWEGFVAMVNLERTKAFGKLVDAAGTFIPKLPWSTEYEKDKFLSPDFTSLEVLSFAGSGIPAGINISSPPAALLLISQC